MPHSTGVDASRRLALWFAVVFAATAPLCFLLADHQTHAFFVGLSQTLPVAVAREFVTPFGQGGPLLLMLACLWLTGWTQPGRRMLRQAAIWAAVALAGGGLSAMALKYLVLRARPMIPLEHVGELTCGYYRSFPSADTASAAAVALTLAVFFPRGRWALALMAVCVAAMRVLRLAHWPSDVCAGLAIGAVAAWAVTSREARGRFARRA